MDLKSFARRKNKGEDENTIIKENPAGKEELEKTVGELSKKSESELMNDLFTEVRRGKQDGSFSEDALAQFMNNVAPMLTPEQMKRMQEITSRLKM